MTTVTDIATAVFTRLSLGTGLDVQTYAEPKMLEMIQHKFDVLFDALWWPQVYSPGDTFTLDGATGVVTSDLSAIIKRWEDIRYVWYGSDRTPMPRANSSINPSTISRRSIVPYNNSSKVFKVLPATTSGTVTIAYRTKPDPFTSESDVPMDRQLMILGCCYDFLVDDDSNPAAVEKFKSMFDTRFSALAAVQNIHGISTEPDGNYGVTEWM